MKKNLLIAISLMIFQAFSSVNVFAGEEAKAYLEITLEIAETNRGAAVNVYKKYKQPFLNKAKGAASKNLLVRKEDVQVLHGFMSVADAEAYLESSLFKDDVVGELGPLLASSPKIRIYEAF